MKAKEQVINSPLSDQYWANRLNKTEADIAEMRGRKPRRHNRILQFCDDVFDDTTEMGAIPSLETLRASRKRIFPITGVYFLFGGDELVYIGQSRNIMLRVAGHTSTGSHLSGIDGFRFDSYTYIYVPENDLDEVERYLIRKHRPKHNIMMNAGELEEEVIECAGS